MTLNEWSSLSEEKQHALIVRWHKDGQWEECYKIASDAANVLRESLKLVPGVANVVVGSGETIYFEKPTTLITELILCVYTDLPRFSKLDGIPQKSSGFRVKQLNFGDERDSFLKTFTFLLKELRGWDEADSLKWAREAHSEQLTNSLVGGTLGVALYSKGPVKIAINALLDPETIRSINDAGKNLIDVRNEILTAIRDATKDAGSSDFDHPDKAADLDWSKLRKSIGELIEKACNRN